MAMNPNTLHTMYNA